MKKPKSEHKVDSHIRYLYNEYSEFKTLFSVDLRNQNIIFKLNLFMQERWNKNFAFNTLKNSYS